MEEENFELTPRNAQEVARRVLALLAVIGKVHQPEQCINWINKNNIWEYLSSCEIAFIKNPSPPIELLRPFSWRAESLVSLIWALNGLSEMPAFNDEFDVFSNEMAVFALNDPDLFLKKASLRDLGIIEEMESFLVHQHWRVRDAETFNIGKTLDPEPNDPPIEELNHGIVYERRYGLSWIVGWGDDWDNVPTDT